MREFVAYWMSQNAFAVRAVHAKATHKPKEFLEPFFRWL
jgi:hypothetical protein